MTTRTFSAAAWRCRRKFLRFFPEGFRDQTYIAWEREYKVETHERWEQVLSRKEFARLLRQREFAEIAARAVRVEQKSRHSMIFSFEKMALRDAVRSDHGAQLFAEALFDFLHGGGSVERRFERWVSAVGSLPRRQTRVLTWPMVTVWGFLAQPERHIFLKPTVTRRAADEYEFALRYRSRPDWDGYESLLEFAALVKGDLADLRPRDRCR